MFDTAERCKRSLARCFAAFALSFQRFLDGWLEDATHERALAGTGDASDDAESADGEADVDIPEVVQASAAKIDPLFVIERTAAAANRMVQRLAQAAAGGGIRVGGDLLEAALRDHAAAVHARARA